MKGNNRTSKGEYEQLENYLNLQKLQGGFEDESSIGSLNMPGLRDLLETDSLGRFPKP